MNETQADKRQQSSANVEASVESFVGDLKTLRDEIGTMIVGQTEIVEGVIMTVLGGGHALTAPAGATGGAQGAPGRQRGVVGTAVGHQGSSVRESTLSSSSVTSLDGTRSTPAGPSVSIVASSATPAAADASTASSTASIVRGPDAV